jgi:hypothetical protein
VCAGVCHSEELSYLFCPEIRKEFNLSLPKSDSEDYKMINHLTQMWTDFAKTGYKNFFSYFIRILQTYILIAKFKLIFRKPTSTNLWLPLTGPQNEDYNYLNINKNSQMKVFRKGEERWDWENKK